MNWSIRSWTRYAVPAMLAFLICGAGLLHAQQPKNGPYRKLAPGVVTTVEPAPQLQETFSRHDILGLVDVDPDFQWAKNVAFRHDIWWLEFRFKPLRMIWVDVPQAGGKMERKLIWYLVYSVTNTGKAMHPVEVADGIHKVEAVDKPVRFVPEFILRDLETNKIYLDRVIPVAMAPIQMREDPNRRFYNSAEMMREIKVGETLWGVATWENVDPRIDRFAVYVKGLTNAYQWEDNQANYKKGDPLSGRRLGVKTLKINFWRPGDEYLVRGDEVRLGLKGQPDYTWVYLY
jgi:hypothetical protein